jgi:crotonobetainyl-CoA:carnitine CoA-transferase CaiB-like acyl-CoA transferase
MTTNTASKPSVERPLAGIRVADFTTFWAGPLVSSYLAFLGAEVVKVESPRRPDPLRYSESYPTADRWGDRSPLFLGVNLGKLGLAVDLTKEKGVEIARRLIASSSVVIESFAPRVMESWGLDADAVREVRPDVVYLRMPAFGLEGSWTHRPGYAMSVDPLSGLAELSGFADEEPLLTGAACDAIASQHGIAAVLAALIARGHTQQGQTIEVALCDVAAQLTAAQTIEFSVSGRRATRTGNRSDSAAPQGIYKCLDGWLAIAVVDDRVWRGLCTLLGFDQSVAALAETQRRARHDEIDDRIGEWCRDRTRADAKGALAAAGVPVAGVIIGPELADHPVLHARQRFERLAHPVVGEVDYLMWPARGTNDAVPAYEHPAPLVGEHNEEILASLGYDRREIAELTAAGVVGSEPLS